MRRVEGGFSTPPPPPVVSNGCLSEASRIRRICRWRRALAEGAFWQRAWWMVRGCRSLVRARGMGVENKGGGWQMTGSAEQGFALQLALSYSVVGTASLVEYSQLVVRRLSIGARPGISMNKTSSNSMNNIKNINNYYVTVIVVPITKKTLRGAPLGASELTHFDRARATGNACLPASPFRSCPPACPVRKHGMATNRIKSFQRMMSFSLLVSISPHSTPLLPPSPPLRTIPLHTARRARTPTSRRVHVSPSLPTLLCATYNSSKPRQSDLPRLLRRSKHPLQTPLCVRRAKSGPFACFGMYVRRPPCPTSSLTSLW